MGSLQSAPMEPPSPARLFAALVGAILVVLGIVGFFSDLSWLNFLYLGSGALGLLAAGRASLPYALAAGLLYTGLAIADFGDRGWLHLAIGVLGLAAVAGTPKPKRQRRLRGSKSTNDVESEPRNGLKRLKPRAKAAAERP
jgi:hypothetical protein